MLVFVFEFCGCLVIGVLFYFFCWVFIYYEVGGFVGLRLVGVWVMGLF